MNATNKRDAAILRLLEENPKATVAEIARGTRIPPSTVHKRLKFLGDSGRVQYRDTAIFPSQAMISLHVDSLQNLPASCPYHDTRSFIEFLEGILSTRIACSFRDSIQINRVFAILGGHCDVILQVSSADQKAIYDFVTQVIRELRGVKNTATSMMFHVKQGDGKGVENARK